MSERGRFITIEGGEGVGKTTNREFIAEWMRERGIPLRITREPGGTPLGESLRQLLLNPDGSAPAPLAELLMVFAARAQHIAEVIEPALSAGEWVLCDRFTDATFAYQGAGRGLDRHAIAQLESLVQGELRPDLVIVLDVDPRVGLQRAKERGELDRFEREAIPFFERVREGYRARASAHPGRYCLVDAGQPLENVTRDLAAALEAFCNDAA
jgi:dTMP kinase